MKMPIFAVQDVLTGFKPPMIAANEEAMIRDYKLWAEKEAASLDMRLFKIGEFNTETGEIIPHTPDCIVGGIENGIQN